MREMLATQSRPRCEVDRHPSIYSENFATDLERSERPHVRAGRPEAVVEPPDLRGGTTPSRGKKMTSSQRRVTTLPNAPSVWPRLPTGGIVQSFLCPLATLLRSRASSHCLQRCARVVASGLVGCQSGANGLGGAAKYAAAKPAGM